MQSSVFSKLLQKGYKKPSRRSASSCAGKKIKIMKHLKYKQQTKQNKNKKQQQQQKTEF